MDKLLAALKRNRHGHRDWLIGLVIYRHGLRVSEACDLRWDEIDLPKRTIIVRRLKGSTRAPCVDHPDQRATPGVYGLPTNTAGISRHYGFLRCLRYAAAACSAVRGCLPSL